MYLLMLIGPSGPELLRPIFPQHETPLDVSTFSTLDKALVLAPRMAEMFKKAGWVIFEWQEFEWVPVQSEINP